MEEGHFFPFGTNEIGRDVYSLNVYAARVSLSVGFAGVLLSFLLGCILGGISGYYGGSADMVIQRFIDFLVSLPQIPLWLAFAAVLPSGWTSIQRYFAITIILSIFGWAGCRPSSRGPKFSVSTLVRHFGLPGGRSYACFRATGYSTTCRTQGFDRAVRRRSGFYSLDSDARRGAVLALRSAGRAWRGWCAAGCFRRGRPTSSWPRA